MDFNFDIFNSFKDGVLIIDKNYNVVFANSSIRNICNLGEGPLQTTCHELSHCQPLPCDFPDFICPQKKVFSTGQSTIATHVHVCPSGDRKVFEITCAPIKDDNNEVVLMMELLRDITDLKKIGELVHLREERLRANEAYLAAVLEGIGDAVVVVDRDYRIVSANEGYLRQTKRPLSEIEGKYCYEISHHSEKPCFETGEDCAAKKAFETGKHHSTLHTHRDRYGNPVYVETNAYPIKDSEGKVASVIETLTDITAKVELEQRLRESEERYRTLYNNSPDMLRSVDMEGRIIEVNNTEAFELGYAKEELTGQHIKKILSPDYLPMFHEKFAQLAKHGQLQTECEYIRKSGEKFPVSVKAHVVYDKNGKFLYTNTVSRDLTDIKKAEVEKKALESQLLQAQKMEAIGNLSAGIAHDFNNMLTGIIGYSELIAQAAGDQEAVEKHAEKILAIAEKSSELIRQILLIGKKLPPKKKPVNLNQLIADSLKIINRMVEENIEIRLLPCYDLPLVNADPSQITQVFLNLLVNARDAMPEGGLIEIKTETADINEEYCRRYPYSKPGLHTVLRISDNGTGIPEGLRDRIFEPFFTTKETGKGTGLGLAVIYSIVKAHSGWIQVFSTEGKGTEFKIFLPVSKDHLTPEAAETHRARKQSLPGGTEMVLLVDDEEIIRNLGELILESLGYRVICAANGEEAISIYRKRGDEIALVIIDKVMPGIDGIQTFHILKKINETLKVILSSGYSDVEAQDLREAGFVGFLNKPYKSLDMAIIVRAAIDSSTSD